MSYALLKEVYIVNTTLHLFEHVNPSNFVKVGFTLEYNKENYTTTSEVYDGCHIPLEIFCVFLFSIFGFFYDQQSTIC